MSQLPTWVTWVQALGSPAIAVAAVVIGVQQYKAARLKVQNDLFDRRYAIFEVAAKFIADINVTGDVTIEQEVAYLKAIPTAQFMFDHKLYEFLFTDVMKHAAQLHALNKSIVVYMLPHERERHFDRVKAETDWFSVQSRTLADRFRPEIELIRRRRARLGKWPARFGGRAR